MVEPKWEQACEEISVELKPQVLAHMTQSLNQEVVLQSQAIEANHACRTFQDQEHIILTSSIKVDHVVLSKLLINYSIGRAQRSEMNKLDTPGPGQYYHNDGQ